MADENWYDGMEGITGNESMLTMAKEFDSAESAVVGGFNAKKAVGAPYKLPKTLESLPDDKVRDELLSQVSGLYGVDTGRLTEVRVSKAEDLADVNFADGLPDASKVNEGLKTAFTDMIIATGAPKSLVQKIITFNNTMVTQAANQKAQTDTEAAGKVSAEVKGLYGGEAGVERHRGLVSALFQAHGGLTTEETEAFATIIQGATKDHVVANKALFNLAKKIMPESTTAKPGEPGYVAKKTSLAETQNKALPHTTGHLWPPKIGA